MIAGALRLQFDFLLMGRDIALGTVASSCINNLVRPVTESRPVVTLPGFAASARSHSPMVGFLNQCGFSAQTFSPGFPSEKAIPDFVRDLEPTLGKLIKELADKHGTPVSLVGQSAGGLYARLFAADCPQEIDRVVTLGAPTNDPAQSTTPNRALEYLVKRISGTAGFDALAGEGGLLHWPANSPELPFVAICSPLDGAVDERAALIPAETVLRSSQSAPRENLRVHCSHFGMAYNPFVMLAVADRLGQQKQQWTDFSPQRYFPKWPKRVISRVFPDPDGNPV
ncbi:MAG: esterase/lipase family protein [Pseudomonadales bacterium]